MNGTSNSFPWGKVAIGCGALVIIIMVVVVGAGIWAFNSTSVTDPVEITALVDRILPGAELPPSHEVIDARDIFGAVSMVTSIDKAGHSILLMRFAGIPDEADVEATQPGEITAQSKETIRVGERDVEFERIESIDGPEDRPFTHYQCLIRIGEETVVLHYGGPTAVFDRVALDGLLSGSTLK